MTHQDRMEFNRYLSRWMYSPGDVDDVIGHLGRINHLYQMTADERRSIAVSVRKRSRRPMSGNAALLRKYTLTPHWMTEDAYQQMLSDFGVEL